MKDLQQSNDHYNLESDFLIHSMTSDGAVGLHKFYDPLFPIIENITPSVSEQTGPGKWYFDPDILLLMKFLNLLLGANINDLHNDITDLSMY